MAVTTTFYPLQIAGMCFGHARAQTCQRLRGMGTPPPCPLQTPAEGPLRSTFAPLTKPLQHQSTQEKITVIKKFSRLEIAKEFRKSASVPLPCFPTQARRLLPSLRHGKRSGESPSPRPPPAQRGLHGSRCIRQRRCKRSHKSVQMITGNLWLSFQRRGHLGIPPLLAVNYAIRHFPQKQKYPPLD